MPNLNNKKILIAGGTGMIGRCLVDLMPSDADVTVVSMDRYSDLKDRVNLIQADLRDFNTCLEVCRGQNIVFNLTGVKGSPAITLSRAADFLENPVLINFNLLKAVYQSGIDWYLLTSSVGVYQPAPLLKEDDVFKTLPSHLEKFAASAKRISELQIEAYSQQYNWKRASIVRPANVFGAYDVFDSENGMVVSSLIYRIAQGENPLKVWGDGSAIRDFIYAKDVAKGMMFTVEREVTEPVNLGTGEGHSIKELAENLRDIMNPNLQIEWDTSKPAGDPVRLMDMSRMKSYGFDSNTPFQEALAETVEWYLNNKNANKDRYNVFQR